MYYIKIDTNRNNTILEYSTTPIIDIGFGEITGTTTYNFPTSQPAIFYRWDGLDVEVNDAATVDSLREEEGGLEGLDLEPFITTVVGGDFLPNTTKEVIINGDNFSPFTLVEISGDGNFVNTVYFDGPRQIRVDITVNGVEGLYNLVAVNSKLTSKDSGYNKIVVKGKTTVDLRTTDVINMGLDVTDGHGIVVKQDITKGLEFDANVSSWNRGVLFTSYMWNRSDDNTFEVIFTKGTDVNFMLGIASASLSVDPISSAYYKQEIGIYHNNNKLVSVYGGGDKANWSQNVGRTVTFTNNHFYKLKLENSGGEGAHCGIYRVNPDDWDDEVELQSWTSTCPADAELLVPFLIPQAANGTYYITGFRY